MTSKDTTLTATTEQEWIVRVYRKTQTSWQRMAPQNSRGQSVAIKATPRTNCIVLHRIQVRIRLSSSKKGSDGDSSTTVYRRRDCILVSSSLRLRSLVLKFQSLQDCLDFSDLFVALNPPQERNLIDARSAAGEVATVPIVNSNTTAAAAASPTFANSTREHGTVQDSNDVLSYAGRLLHDEDFSSFVDNLESCLLSSEDGQLLLEALVNGSKPMAQETDSSG